MGSACQTPPDLKIISPSGDIIRVHCEETACPDPDRILAAGLAASKCVGVEWGLWSTYAITWAGFPLYRTRDGIQIWGATFYNMRAVYVFDGDKADAALEWEWTIVALEKRLGPVGEAKKIEWVDEHCRG